MILAWLHCTMIVRFCARAQARQELARRVMALLDVQVRLDINFEARVVVHAEQRDCDADRCHDAQSRPDYVQHSVVHGESCGCPLLCMQSAELLMSEQARSRRL
jgi:hypothetical protein